MKVLGVFIELESEGGVQRLGRHMALALSRYCRREGHELEIISFVDEGEREFEISGERVVYRGFAKSKARMQMKVLGTSCDFAYVNHAFIAPLVYTKKIVSRRFQYAVHVHGIEMWSPMAWTRRKALQSAGLITGTSRHSGKEAIRNQGLQDPWIETLYPPLDPCIDAFADSIGIEQPYVLTVSRMGREDSGKKLDAAIEAFASLAEDFPDWKYVIVGSGPTADYYNRLADAVAPKGRIVFTGRVDDAQLMSLYRDCSFFLLPSKKEGLGIVFLEAMYHGKAVLGAPFGGTPEVVRDGETGLLADPDKANALKDALRQLMVDSGKREKLGKAGRDLVSSEFCYEAFEERFWGLMDRLLAKTCGTAKG